MANLPGNQKKVKTVVVKAGETGVVPAGVNIISVGIIGNPDVESDCANVNEAISNAENYACYEFVWEVDEDYGGSNPTWTAQDVTLQAIQIGDTSYEIGILTSDPAGFTTKIKDTVPNSLMKMGPATNGEGYYSGDGGNHKSRQEICFLTVPSVAEVMQIKFLNGRVNDDSVGVLPEYYIKPRPFTSGQTNWCKCPGSTTETLT